MAQEFSTVAKNQALDAITIDRMSLHDGDPGSSGTANEISGGGYARQVCSFNAASSGSRALASEVTFSGPALGDVTWIGLWLNSGSVFKMRSPVESGDMAFNASGVYRVTTATTISLSDPS